MIKYFRRRRAYREAYLRTYGVRPAGSGRLTGRHFRLLDAARQRAKALVDRL